MKITHPYSELEITKYNNEVRIDLTNYDNYAFIDLNRDEINIVIEHLKELICQLS